MAHIPSLIESVFSSAAEAEAYDRWFRSQVLAALHEAEDPAAQWVPHDQMEAELDAVIHAAEQKIATRG